MTCGQVFLLSNAHLPATAFLALPLWSCGAVRLCQGNFTHGRRFYSVLSLLFSAAMFGEYCLLFSNACWLGKHRHVEKDWTRTEVERVPESQSRLKKIGAKEKTPQVHSPCMTCSSWRSFQTGGSDVGKDPRKLAVLG